MKPFGNKKLVQLVAEDEGLANAVFEAALWACMFKSPGEKGGMADIEIELSKSYFLCCFFRRRIKLTGYWVEHTPGGIKRERISAGLYCTKCGEYYNLNLPPYKDSNPCKLLDNDDKH